jgi:RNA-directed DNA polymerase
MTADSSAGAASHNMVDWQAIDWRKANQNVRRLQARIVKAIQEGRWGKAKTLQHLLTRSFSAKALAVKRVTENQGKNTAGVDGQTWNTPLKKAAAVSSLRQYGYRPQPLRRTYIPKSNGKMRPLGIPTIRDRAMQALYLLALEPVAETNGDLNSYGFRTARSTADAIGQCFNVLNRRCSAQWILEGDIKACFDRISHDWLLTNTPIEKTILRQWLKTGYIERRIWHPTNEGTPQGGIISPVLANLTLDGLEKELKNAFSRPRKGQENLVNLVRYADDFIITGRSKELLESEVLPLVETFLQPRGLELSKEKTHITHITNGFDFLGQNVRKYDGTLLIKPSRKNTHAFLTKVRKTIKANSQSSAGTLVVLLNPIIRGWTNYHRHVVSKAVFNSMDHAIFKSLWQWAKRRHPNKSHCWIKDKYFQTVGSQNWVFHGEADGKNYTLYSAAHTRIVRHIKVISQANPFDPHWYDYFEQRQDRHSVGRPCPSLGT